MDLDAKVVIGGGAVLDGADSVSLTANLASVEADSDARGATTTDDRDSVAGDPDAEATVTMDTAAQVTTATGSKITTQVLNISALTDETLSDVDAFADHDDGGFGIQLGSGPRMSESMQADRIIDFNSTVTMLVAANPFLIIEADGTVRSEAITYTENTTDIFINDLINQGSVGGQINLKINQTGRDGEMSNPRVIKGQPTVIFQTAYDEVTIRNETAKNLVLRKIDVGNEAATAADLIRVPVQPTTNSLAPITNSDPNGTKITIENAQSVSIGDLIDNPLGTTSITALAGNIVPARLAEVDVSHATTLDGGTIPQAIFSATSNAKLTLASDSTVSTVTKGKRWTIKSDDEEYDVALGDSGLSIFLGVGARIQRAIETDELSLSATGGIGFENYGLPIIAGKDDDVLLAAGDSGLVSLEVFAGDAIIETVRSGNHARLIVEGSIVDADDAAEGGLDFSATTLLLEAIRSTDSTPSATDRTIGALTNPLEIGVRDTFAALAGGHIALSQSSAMTPQTLYSSLGDILLTVADADGSGQDITLSSSSSLTAVAGNITLNVGDNLESAGSIQAGASLNVNADQAGLDVGTGATLNFLGELKVGSSVVLVTGADADTINFRRLDSTATVNMQTGASADVINIGSTGGLLSPLRGTFTIDAGEEANAVADLLVIDQINLDDSGRSATSPQNVTSVASSVSTSDAALTIGGQTLNYANAENVVLSLGSGNDTVGVSFTAADTELTINLN
ncbi:MAG: hypothetical protein MI861_20075, partial [Pirellulales bacterium]|nr:hypothetical protein [Pirellulales bacterium]